MPYFIPRDQLVSFFTGPVMDPDQECPTYKVIAEKILEHCGPDVAFFTMLDAEGGDPEPEITDRFATKEILSGVEYDLGEYYLTYYVHAHWEGHPGFYGVAVGGSPMNSAIASWLIPSLPVSMSG